MRTATNQPCPSISPVLRKHELSESLIALDELAETVTYAAKRRVNPRGRTREVLPVETP
jgi:hypothetical protein